MVNFKGRIFQTSSIFYLYLLIYPQTFCMIQKAGFTLLVLAILVLVLDDAGQARDNSCFHL